MTIDPTSGSVTERKLITVYNPADGSYKVYTAKDYLSQKRAVILQECGRQGEGDGISGTDRRSGTKLKSNDFVKDKKYGIMIFGAFSAMGVLLSLWSSAQKEREGRK